MKKILSFFESLRIDYKELENLEDDYTLLCGINKKVNNINQEKLSKLETPLVCFKAQVKKEDKRIKDEELDSWIRSLNILEELNIKIGARIIFCVNNWDKNYYNGEQGIIEDILYEEEKIYISIIKNNGMKILLEPYTFSWKNLNNQVKILLLIFLQVLHSFLLS